MTVVKFRRVELREPRTGTCTGCGRLRKKTIVVWQTLSPFNLNANKIPKSEAEVLAELRAELAAKRAAPHLCRTCEGLKNGGGHRG